MRRITTKVLPVQLRGVFPGAQTGHQDDEMHITSANGMSSRDSVEEYGRMVLMVEVPAWLLGRIKAMVVMRSPITVERRYVLVVVQYIYPGRVEEEERGKQGRTGPSHCHSCQTITQSASHCHSRPLEGHRSSSRSLNYTSRSVPGRRLDAVPLGQNMVLVLGKRRGIVALIR